MESQPRDIRGSKTAVAARSRARLLLLPAVALLALAFPAARAWPAGRHAQRSGEAPKAGEAPAGNAENGKKLYMSDGCYECHGTVGQGATQTGAARIGPPQLPVDSFIRYVHHPSGQMPPYTDKVLSDKDLADIYAYLKTIPMPPKGKDIPLLNK